MVTAALKAMGQKYGGSAMGKNADKQMKAASRIGLSKGISNTARDKAYKKARMVKK